MYRVHIDLQLLFRTMSFQSDVCELSHTAVDRLSLVHEAQGEQLAINQFDLIEN